MISAYLTNANQVIVFIGYYLFVSDDEKKLSTAECRIILCRDEVDEIIMRQERAKTQQKPKKSVRAMIPWMQKESEFKIPTLEKIIPK